MTFIKTGDNIEIAAIIEANELTEEQKKSAQKLISEPQEKSADISFRSDDQPQKDAS
jgi:hypothetical protein